MFCTYDIISFKYRGLTYMLINFHTYIFREHLMEYVEEYDLNNNINFIKYHRKPRLAFPSNYSRKCTS